MGGYALERVIGLQNWITRVVDERVASRDAQNRETGRNLCFGRTGGSSETLQSLTMAFFPSRLCPKDSTGLGKVR